MNNKIAENIRSSRSPMPFFFNMSTFLCGYRNIRASSAQPTASMLWHLPLHDLVTFRSVGNSANFTPLRLFALFWANSGLHWKLSVECRNSLDKSKSGEDDCELADANFCIQTIIDIQPKISRFNREQSQSKMRSIRINAIEIIFSIELNIQERLRV